MIENAKLYKQISLEIVEMLNKKEIDLLESFLDKRQEILDKEINVEKFKLILLEDGIIDIDKNIQTLLNENIDNVKDEIREYKLTKQANNSYINFNKEKLNIFNKKV